MYKEHISSADSDYDKHLRSIKYQDYLWYLRCRARVCIFCQIWVRISAAAAGCVRAAAVILIRGELTILSPLVSFGSVCWLIAHSAPPTAPPRPADHKNQTVENFLISRALKYENGPSISIFILTIIHRGDYFPVSIILDFPNHNYWPFIVELKGIRWAGWFSEPLLSS